MPIVVGGTDFKIRRRTNVIFTSFAIDGTTASTWYGNHTRPKDRVIVEYKYGPLTTMRRGEAMKKRREVLEAKLFRNAFVKFSAILMGRKDEEDNYSEIENYSSKCVSKLAVFGE